MHDPIVPAMTENVPKDITMTSETGPYSAEFGAILHERATGFLFTVSPPSFADDVAKALNAELAALSRAPEAEDCESGGLPCARLTNMARAHTDAVKAALSPPSTGGEGEAVAWRCLNVHGDAFLTEDANGAHFWLKSGKPVQPLYLHPSPEMGEIIRELQNIRVGMLDHYQAATMLERLVQKAQALKLKENGLSREELGGLAQSLPSGDAQERSPVPPLSDGWQDIATAPKDGQDVLIWNAEGAEIARWYPFEGDGSDQPGHDEGWIGTFAFPGRSWGYRLRSEPQGQPSHWMPLPSPPQNSDGKAA